MIQELANCFVSGLVFPLPYYLPLVSSMSKGKRLFLPSMHEDAWVCTDEYGPMFVQARVYINLKERAHVYTDDFAPSAQEVARR